ncbi:OsmC family protein [Tengunoibacter tsumagoiensis]|uniref:Peroxiredoxin n=1 Tax=Tengunoibacter tsumagoiensis TaxID=2014871 RepID=A0A402AAJ7_9CHLR|nr:OsmC family protein [Tengunoibacter tsumagoiensis]GCE16193.1 peroxiredoxin [Tengunoibacter tsumagoiensis]
MAGELRVGARWQHGMRFAITTGSGHSISVDAATTDGGENGGARPMELLIAGLAGCAGMDIISILRKMRQDVTSYEVQISSERREELPKIFTTINVQHLITGRAIKPSAVERALELTEELYCGASAVLSKSGAEVTHTYQIIESELSSPL